MQVNTCFAEITTVLNTHDTPGGKGIVDASEHKVVVSAARIARGVVFHATAVSMSILRVVTAGIVAAVTQRDVARQLVILAVERQGRGVGDLVLEVHNVGKTGTQMVLDGTVGEQLDDRSCARGILRIRVTDDLHALDIL